MRAFEALCLTLAEARALAVAAQGLNQPTAAPVDAAAVLRLVDRLGVLQVDTIKVVERSQYLVLWSRLGAFDPALLDDLLYTQRRLFECMAPVALIAPIRSYRYYRPGMLRAAREMWHVDRGWMAEHPEVLRAVQDTLRLHGPRASGDFERPAGARRSGPWDWHGPKPSRRALEILFAMGEVMVHSRKGGQKVYDLRERVLSEALHGDLPDDADLPSAEERLRFFALHAAEALGVIQLAWLWEYHAVRPDPPAGHTHRLAAQAMLDDLCREGHLVPAAIEGLEGPAYLAASLLGSLAAVRAGTATVRTTLLSPFDSLIWDRARTRALFGFDVCFEAYVPPPKRKYGYYCLPILHRNQLVGRVDAKADRVGGTLLLRAVYLEPQTVLDEGLVAGLAGAVRDLAAFLRLPGTKVALAGHQELAALLGERLRA